MGSAIERFGARRIARSAPPAWRRLRRTLAIRATRVDLAGRPAGRAGRCGSAMRPSADGPTRSSGEGAGEDAKDGSGSVTRRRVTPAARWAIFDAKLISAADETAGSAGRSNGAPGAARRAGSPGAGIAASSREGISVAGETGCRPCRRRTTIRPAASRARAAVARASAATLPRVGRTTTPAWRTSGPTCGGAGMDAVGEAGGSGGTMRRPGADADEVDALARGETSRCRGSSSIGGDTSGTGTCRAPRRRRSSDRRAGDGAAYRARRPSAAQAKSRNRGLTGGPGPTLWMTCADVTPIRRGRGRPRRRRNGVGRGRDRAWERNRATVRNRHEVEGTLMHLPRLPS